MGQSVSLEGVHILVAEDEYLQALGIAQSLKEAGAIILGPVSTSQKAFELISEHPCSAAIQDFRLAGDDITAFAYELDRRRIPFILHSGYDYGDLPRSIFGQSWNCRFIPKPSITADLVDAVGELINKRSQLTEPVFRYAAVNI